MQTKKAMVSGAAGAATLTLAHEILRQIVPRSPRLDELGMEGARRLMRIAGVRPPRGETLRGISMLGDLVANTLYFAPIAARRHVSLLQGTVVGTLAGLGAVFLGPKLGFSKRHSGLRRETQLMTVGLYTLGGLAAAAMGKLMRSGADPDRTVRLLPAARA